MRCISWSNSKGWLIVRWCSRALEPKLNAVFIRRSFAPCSHCRAPSDSEFEAGDGGGFVEGSAVHFRCDGVAREEFGADAREHEHAGRVGRKPGFLAAERKDDRHPSWM